MKSNSTCSPRKLFAALLVAVASTSHAQTTYDLAAFPFVYRGASSANGTFVTSAQGTFTDSRDIENIFNSSQYSATLLGPSGILSTIDNTNSQWRVNASLSGSPQMTVTISATRILLSFSTQSEFSGIALLLQSNDLLTVLQYRQENNVSNYSFVDFEFNAVHDANYSTAYGATFMLPAVAVPELPTSLLLAFGLPLLASRIVVARNASQKMER